MVRCWSCSALPSAVDRVCSCVSLRSVDYCTAPHASRRITAEPEGLIEQSVRTAESARPYYAAAGTGLDPDELRSCYHSTNIGRSNFSGLNNLGLDELLTRGANQPMGNSERRQTYETIQRRLMDLLPFVSLMSQRRLQAMSSRVHGFAMRPDALNAYPHRRRLARAVKARNDATDAPRWIIGRGARDGTGR